MTIHTDMASAFADAESVQCWMGWVPPRPAGRRFAKDAPREADAVTALEAAGLRAWAPVGLRLVRRGKDRRASVIPEVLVPGVVFVWADLGGFYRAIATGHVATAMTALTRRDMADLQRWIGAVEDMREDVEARQREMDRPKGGRIAKRSRRREYMSPFGPGDLMRVTSGPLADSVARFVRMVGRLDGQPEIVAELDAFGATATVRIDPLDVRAAS